MTKIGQNARNPLGMLLGGGNQQNHQPAHLHQQRVGLQPGPGVPVGQAPGGQTAPPATCQLCLKTKFADGVGHICNYCSVSTVRIWDTDRWITPSIFSILRAQLQTNSRASDPIEYNMLIAAFRTQPSFPGSWSSSAAELLPGDFGSRSSKNPLRVSPLFKPVTSLTLMTAFISTGAFRAPSAALTRVQGRIIFLSLGYERQRNLCGRSHKETGAEPTFP